MADAYLLVQKTTTEMGRREGKRRRERGKEGKEGQGKGKKTEKMRIIDLFIIHMMYHEKPTNECEAPLS